MSTELTQLSFSSLTYHYIDLFDQDELVKHGRGSSATYSISFTGYLKQALGPIEEDSFVSVVVTGDNVTLGYGTLKRSDEDDDEKMNALMKCPPSFHTFKLVHKPPEFH